MRAALPALAHRCCRQTSSSSRRACSVARRVRDARAQGQQLLAAQVIGEAGIPGEDDAQQGLGVEAGAGEQAQLVEHGGTHLLCFVHQQHGTPTGGLQMAEPGGTQRLEAAPAVVRTQRDAEQLAELAVEIPEAALRMIDGADGEIREPGEALGEQTQHHAFAGTRFAVDHRKPAFADLRLLDTPQEVFHARGDVERLDRQFRGEGMPFQAVEGEQSRIHRVSSAVFRGR